MRAVEMLRDQYHWKSRPDFTVHSHVEPTLDVGTVGVVISGETVTADRQVQLTASSDSQPISVDQETRPNASDDDDKPLDPDDDLFEEVA